MKTSLQLHDINLMVSLGHFDWERENLQRVRIDLVIDLAEAPKACDTDQLSDTYCYDALVSLLVRFCENQSFRLIEHLAKQLHAQLKAQLSAQDKLTLTLTKLTVPVDEIQGGATFMCSDG